MLWIKKIKEHKSIKDKTVNLLSMTAGRSVSVHTNNASSDMAWNSEL